MRLLIYILLSSLVLNNAIAHPVFDNSYRYKTDATLPGTDSKDVCSVDRLVFEEIQLEAKLCNQTIFNYITRTVLGLSKKMSNFTCYGVCAPLDYIGSQLDNRKQALLLAELLKSSGAPDVPLGVKRIVANDLPTPYRSPLRHPRYAFYEKYSAATCIYWLALWGRNLYAQIKSFYLQSLSFFLDFELGPAFEIFISGVSHEVGDKLPDRSEKLINTLSGLALASSFVQVVPWVVCGFRAAIARTTHGFWDENGPLLVANGLLSASLGTIASVTDLVKGVSDYMQPENLEWKQIWRYKLRILDGAETNMMMFSEGYSASLNNDKWLANLALSVGNNDAFNSSLALRSTKTNTTSNSTQKSLDLEMHEIYSKTAVVGNLPLLNTSSTAYSHYVASGLPALRSDLFCIWRLQLFKMVLQEFGKLYYCIPLGEYAPIDHADTTFVSQIRNEDAGKRTWSQSMGAFKKNVVYKTKSILQKIQFHKELDKNHAENVFNISQTSSESSGDSVSDIELVMDKARLDDADKCFPKAKNGTLFVTNQLDPPYAVWTLHKTEHFDQALALLGLDEEDFWLHWDKGFTCGGGGGYDTEIASPDPYVKELQQQIFKGNWMDILRTMKKERVPRGNAWMVASKLGSIL